MNYEFNNEENMNLLWEIIYDLHITNNNSNINEKLLYNIKQDFLQKINNFTEVIKKNKTNIDLLGLNKIFISNYVKSITNNSEKYENKNSKVEIDRTLSVEPKQKPEPEPEPELITFEEIQKNKRSIFSEGLKLKKKEFEESIKIKVPEIPDFKFDNPDKPISEMEKLISETLAQRNFDIEQIQNQYTTTKDAEKWLQPKETSIKVENEFLQKPLNVNVNDESVISEKEKHVTWGDNITFDVKEKMPEIYSKLKFKTSEKQETQINEKINENTQKDDITKIQEDVKNINDKLKIIEFQLNKLLEK
jgi:hypothetical protein